MVWSRVLKSYMGATMESMRPSQATFDLCLVPTHVPSRANVAAVGVVSFSSWVAGGGHFPISGQWA